MHGRDTLPLNTTYVTQFNIGSNRARHYYNCHVIHLLTLHETGCFCLNFVEFALSSNLTRLNLIVLLCAGYQVFLIRIVATEYER